MTAPPLPPPAVINRVTVYPVDQKHLLLLDHSCYFENLNIKNPTILVRNHQSGLVVNNNTHNYRTAQLEAYLSVVSHNLTDSVQ